ncbi:hypothetical protein [Clostridium sp. B9]|uniref:hypothetical protein n=1 Tax=Clostridium sp. B9 TaxID=3423224 RepID=UPI003D2EEADD
MKVICDACKEEFEVKQQIEKVEKDIRRVYFICPSCGQKYIAYYLSNRIENMQKRTNKLLEKWKTTPGTNEKNKERYDKWLKSKEETKAEMQRLKEKYKEVK